MFTDPSVLRVDWRFAGRTIKPLQFRPGVCQERNARRALRGSQMTPIDLPMSRQDIADFLGLKKETVSRSFTRLDERDLIARPDNFHAEILDLAGLRQLAGIQDFQSPLRLVAED